ncbi:hypothetical protein M501DRAFT_990597 [Patellaria atrata CBS 101060]|uniref:F-box domain-containing protein n=1 Tax=Patellaria atrata CBS 101060 TaxID=1346257 RepID=A0A9P4SF10_9PEZI|nr:hypothetical protein M501DRAFT_990597 [Patellaria atrata CBS 101060]
MESGNQSQNLAILTVVGNRLAKYLQGSRRPAWVEDLPDELLEMLSYNLEQGDLANLSLVSKRTRDVSVRALYKDITVVEETAGSSKALSRIKSMFRILMEAPELGKYTESFTVRCSESLIRGTCPTVPFDPNGKDAQLISLFTQKFSQVNNLAGLGPGLRENRFGVLVIVLLFCFPKLRRLDLTFDGLCSASFFELFEATLKGQEIPFFSQLRKVTYKELWVGPEARPCLLHRYTLPESGPLTWCPTFSLETLDLAGTCVDAQGFRASLALYGNLKVLRMTDYWAIHDISGALYQVKDTLDVLHLGRRYHRQSVPFRLDFSKFKKLHTLVINSLDFPSAGHGIPVNLENKFPASLKHLTFVHIPLRGSWMTVICREEWEMIDDLTNGLANVQLPNLQDVKIVFPNKRAILIEARWNETHNQHNFRTFCRASRECVLSIHL